MSTISSPGLASGIDVKSIVSQLTALERAPLQPLQRAAGSLRSQISGFGSLKSMVAGLGDAAAKLSTPSGWNGVKATSSNPAAVGVSASPGTSATSLSVEVVKLAQAQSASSAAITTGTGIGTGTLSIQVGAGAPVNVVIGTGKDNLTEVARQINEAKAGVSATVLRDASGERLLMRAISTGSANTITVGVTGGTPGGLDRLAFGPGATGGMTQTQAAQNAEAKINNVTVTSGTNTLADTVPGLTLTLSQITNANAPVEVGVSADRDAMRQNIQGFVDAYNAINDLLAETTKYDPATKVAGSLQGNSTALGLQNALRSMMRSATESSPFSNLSAVGIEAQKGGKLTINSSKLNTAMENLEGLQSLFTTTGTSPATQGFGLKIKAFADGLTNATGTLSTKAKALQDAVSRNSAQQDKVNERASRAEVRFRAQYNAMDTAVGRLNGLNAFVSQQITLWNRNTG